MSITKEEVQRLFNHCETSEPTVLSGRMACEIRDLCLSRLREPSGTWVPVSERLPEYGVDVMIYHVLGDRDRPEVPHAYDVGWLLKDGWYFPWDRGRDKQRPMFVTHWIPLPSPPASAPAREEGPQVLVHDGESGRTERFTLPATRHPIRCKDGCAFPTFDLPCTGVCKLLSDTESAERRLPSQDEADDALAEVGQVLEMCRSLLNDIVRRAPGVKTFVDDQAFIQNEINPALVKLHQAASRLREPRGAEEVEPFAHKLCGLIERNGGKCDEELRAIARRHAVNAVCPPGSLLHEPEDAIVIQETFRAEEVIFYALQELLELLSRLREPSGTWVGSGNYVADKEIEPTKVTFANGRVVRAIGGYLVVE